MTEYVATSGWAQAQQDRLTAFVDWLLRRNSWRLLRALPGVLLLAVAGVLAGLIALDDHESRLGRYREAGQRAIRMQDYPTAALIFKRLVLNNAGGDETRYNWAVAVDHLGDTARVEALLDDLAPAEGRGYLPAHLWRAKRLLAGKPDGARLKAAEGHLQRILDAQPDLHEAHVVLGQVCLASRRPAEAVGHLAKALPTRPDLELAVAKLYATQGKRDLAARHAQAAQAYYRRLAEKTPSLAEPRLHWAEAALLVGDAGESVAILQAGLQQHDDPVYRRAIAQAYLAWSDAVARDQPATAGLRFKLLEEALRYDVANFPALGRLLMVARDDGKPGSQAKSLLQKLLADGQAAGLVHLLLGMQARDEGKTAEARAHFEQAYRTQPHLTAVVNNLAWALAHAEPADLPRALSLIDSLLERSSTDPNFRETRGQILAKQGRWSDAVTDLEIALPHMPNNAALHATLAQVYRQLGLSDLAQEHERFAARGR